MMHSAAEKKNMILTLVVHIIVTVSTAVTAIRGILCGASCNEDGDHLIGMGYFKAFTMDSNILAGICALLIVCCAVRSLLKKEDTMPKWIAVFQYMAADCLFLTIVTVTLVLAPMDVLQGKPYSGMFSGDFFIFHLTNPLLVISAFVFLQRKYSFRRKDCILGMIFPAVYAAVYFLMVAVFRKWNDIYGFSFGGRYYLAPVLIIAVLLLTYLLSRLLIWLNGRASGRI